ncbi:iron-sulfur cluster assembly scaffold protein [bacterium]|nr:MAG: iron-sulfur cluster assembly scaffold protein [bacterium]
MYNKKVLQYFKNPRNFGKIKNPDGIGKVGNLICGDVMQLYIKVDKNKKGEEIIKDIKFEAYGCVAALASSSIITDLAKGKTIKQALKINQKQMIDSLGVLPPVKTHCSVLAIDALSEAIYDYLIKNNKIVPKELEELHKRIENGKKIIEKRYK